MACTGRVSAELAKNRAQRPTLVFADPKDRHQVSCELPDACKTDVRKQLADDGLKTYPYVNLISWIGKDGWQRVKWTPGVAITPFINLRDERVPYLGELERAWQTRVSDDSPPMRGVSVLQSPNTSEPLTVFWRVSSRGDGAMAASQSIATFSPIAFDRPTLPKGVSFAVVDSAGRALFHSDPTRSLQENFLKECGDNPALSAAITGRQGAGMKAYYLGRPIRLRVSPLPLALPEPFKNPRWSLITFQDSVTADTINLETVTVACLLLAAYGGVLAIASLMVCAFARVGWTKWFWPASGNDAAYTRAAWLNGAVTIGFVCLAPFLPPAWSWLLIVLIAPAVLFATRWIVVHSGSHEAPRGFGQAHPFFLARAVFLLVVAGLPAIASFQVAYAFETKLLATSEHMQEVKDTASLGSRIDQFVARFSLRDAATTQALTEERNKLSKELKWDSVHATLWPESSGSSRSMLDSILAPMHQPYNEVALDLRTAADNAELNWGAASAAGFWVVALLVGVLFSVCYAVVYFLIKPLFVMEAVALRFPSVTKPLAAPHVLTVGPPGSGKSVRLAADTSMRVFDVARLGYVDRRTKAGIGGEGAPASGGGGRTRPLGGMVSVRPAGRRCPGGRAECRGVGGRLRRRDAARRPRRRPGHRPFRSPPRRARLRSADAAFHRAGRAPLQRLYPNRLRS